MTALQLISELAWKSTLIAAGALALSTALRGYAPRYRAALCHAALIGLLTLPGLILLLPASELTFPALFEPSEIAPISPAATIDVPAIVRAKAPDVGMVAIIVYGIGLAGLLAYLTLGLGILATITRRARAVTSTEWQRSLADLRHARSMRNVDLRCSERIDSPLSWGWLRPAIVIDLDSLDHPQRAEGVLAHELAHIARHDWPMMIVSRVVLALYWFNPLVWLLVRGAADLVEQAADASAVHGVDRLAYARTLTQCARTRRTLQPASAIASSPNALKRRVQILVDDHIGQSRQGMTLPALAILACSGMGTLLASAQLKPYAAVSGPHSEGLTLEGEARTAIVWSSSTSRIAEPEPVAIGPAANPVGNAAGQTITASSPDDRTETQTRPGRSTAASGASGQGAWQQRDQQARGALATRLGDLETERGARRTRAGDALARRGIFETKRGEILTRLGNMETKRGEEQNRRAALHLGNENNSGGSGGPAP